MGSPEHKDFGWVHAMKEDSSVSSQDRIIEWAFLLLLTESVSCANIANHPTHASSDKGRLVDDDDDDLNNNIYWPHSREQINLKIATRFIVMHINNEQDIVAI